MPSESSQGGTLRTLTNSDMPNFERYFGMESTLHRLIDEYDIGVGGPISNGIRVPVWAGLGSQHPFDTVAWETGPVSVNNETGATIFTEPAAEFPATWSEHARSIVASKYFYGDHGQGFRETSLKQLLFRVSTEIAIVAIEDSTFYDKIDCINFYCYLLMMQLHQYFAFNSPVYFNVGTWIYSDKVAAENYYWDRKHYSVAPCPDAGRHPQISACFIQSVEDNMQSIMDLATSEAMLFKRGSGTGTDLSPLRSCKESLSGGGKPSGPLSFMKVYDAVASVVKSGGKCLAPNQPVLTAAGIRTARELAESGQDFTVLSYSQAAGRIMARTARAWHSGQKQVYSLLTDRGEYNLSFDHPVMLKTGEFVRVADLSDGMSLLSCSSYGLAGGYSRIQIGSGQRELMHRLVARDVCGWDIGNKIVHHGIRGSKDSEPDNLQLMPDHAAHASLHGGQRVADGTHVFQINRYPKPGDANGMHASSEFWADSERSEAYRQTQGAILKASGRAAAMQESARRTRMLNLGYELINSGYDISSFEGYVSARKAVGRRCASVPGQRAKFGREFGSYEEYYRALRAGNQRVISVKSIGVMDVYDIEVDACGPDDGQPWDAHNFAIMPTDSPNEYGSFIFVHNTRRAAKMQSLKTDHPDIMDFIEAKVKEERKARALIAQGYEANFNGEAYSSVFFQNSNLSVRASDTFMNAVENNWKFPTFARTTGQEVELLHAPTVMQSIAESAYACGDPGLQFDDTINRMNPTPKAGRINASNPCSEYMYIDDSACNLASLNLLKFRSLNTQTHDMMLDICKFNECVDVAIVAMDTLVDHGSYPTAKIAAHSHALRPLGLGYANAGAYLMAAGIPYDSDAGCGFVAVISCLLTGEAYCQSGRLARRFGPIDGWMNHKDDFIGVMNNHINTLGQECIPLCDDDLVESAAKSWNQALEYATYHGIRNAQATCIAPTGTISFMMDCDTLGIEPEIALVRYKHLAGRGMLKLVNQTVPLALRSLGYSEGQIGEILGHIERFGTIESVGLDCGDGADVEPMDCLLKEEHLPVFDCAFAPADGIDPVTGRKFFPRWHRSIVVMGHVDMLAAATPAISGAISKTVNMPSWYTTNSIKEVYMKAWRLGCKAISIYRDGSKDSQPITTAVPAAHGEFPTGAKAIMDRMAKELGQLHTELENARAPYRRKMPDNRKAQVHKFSVAGHEGYIICGFYPDDDQLGEVFIEISKNGSTVGGLMGVIGTLISVSLQYGVPLVKIVEKLANHRFEPAGITGNRDIPFAKSLIDYIAHWLGCEFIDGYRATVRPRRADDQTPAEPAGPGSMENPLHRTEEYTTEQSGGPVIAVNGWPDRQQDRQSFSAQIHGPSCPNCGAIMVQQGPCAVCFNCAHTEGGCGG
jgi:ribonucleoside-diphosphate reductase alpha chain